MPLAVRAALASVRPAVRLAASRAALASVRAAGRLAASKAALASVRPAGRLAASMTRFFLPHRCCFEAGCGFLRWRSGSALASLLHVYSVLMKKNREDSRPEAADLQREG